MVELILLHYNIAFGLALGITFLGYGLELRKIKLAGLVINLFLMSVLWGGEFWTGSFAILTLFGIIALYFSIDKEKIIYAGLVLALLTPVLYIIDFEQVAKITSGIFVLLILALPLRHLASVLNNE